MHTLGDYILIETILEGPFSTIWRARKRGDARWFTVEVTPGHFALSEEVMCARPAVGQEGPQRMIEQCVVEGHHLKVWEEFLSTDLETMILSREIPRDPMWLAEVGHRLCETLSALHALGQAHGALQPRHVEVTPCGVVLLSGGAPTWTSGVEAISFSPCYAAPELIQTGERSASADIFALGTLLYEAITGTNPYRGRDAVTTVFGILEGEPVPPPQGVCPELGGIISRAMSRDPATRFASAESMSLALEAVLGRQPDDVTRWSAAEALERLRAWLYEGRRDAVCSALQLNPGLLDYPAVADYVWTHSSDWLMAPISLGQEPLLVQLHLLTRLPQARPAVARVCMDVSASPSVRAQARRTLGIIDADLELLLSDSPVVQVQTLPVLRSRLRAWWRRQVERL